jgi:crotonobetainyl-CoA:carnitine CoA-transferase CaiB-like acyl-CoA transferase
LSGRHVIEHGRICPDFEEEGQWQMGHRTSYGRSSAISFPSAADFVLASVVPYRAFQTSDGDVLFGGGNDRLFGILCTGLGKQEWASDERFATNAARVANRSVLEPAIEEITKQKTTQEWLDIFEGTGLPYAKVNDLMDTLNHKHGESPKISCRNSSSSLFNHSSSPRYGCLD